MAHDATLTIRIEQSVKDRLDGEGMPHEDVVVWVESWGTDGEIPTPKR